MFDIFIIHYNCQFINNVKLSLKQKFSEAGNAYSFGTHELTHGFEWGSCCLTFSLLCGVF